MTRTELTAILGSRMIRSTNHPGVVELLPRSFFGRSEDREKLERMINALIVTHSRVFYCPHEEWEGEARYKTWDMVEPGIFLVPPTATADDIMNDPEHPVGWTIYAASKPLTEVQDRNDLGSLIDDRRIAALVQTDPDGNPWLAAVAAQ